MDTILHQLHRLTNISLNTSNILLLVPTFTAILIIYLQHKRIINSPFRDHPTTNSSTNILGKCSNCSASKPIKELKSCSRCKSNNRYGTQIYFCDQTCQRENWKVHRLSCGKWEDPQPIQDPLPDGLSRVELEKKLGLWCEYHRHLLIFATIHALDLTRNAKNSLQSIYLISITHQSGQEVVHRTFSLEQHSVFDLNAFAQANPGMSSALSEMEKLRVKIISKGGLGVGMLLVRCGPVVQVVPVGLPSQSDLDSVKREKDWKVKFEEGIKAGLQLTPLSRPPST